MSQQYLVFNVFNFIKKIYLSKRLTNASQKSKSIHTQIYYMIKNM